MDLGDVARIAASVELQQAIGADYAALFQQRVAQAQGAAAKNADDAEELYELVRHAISLQNLVDSDEEDEHGVLFTAVNDDEAACSAAVAVAEAISSSLAAFAGFLSSTDTRQDGRFTDLVHRLSIDLDVFSGNLFTGLQRLEDVHFFEPGARALQWRLMTSLQSICLWAVVVVGHVVGFACFTSCVLWEWVWRDALWACILVKGALAALSEEDNVVLSDRRAVRQMLLQALLGLSSPDVAFFGQAAVDGDETAIAQRNEALILHRRTLAWAVLNSRLLQVLLAAASEAPELGGLLASFLASLLQPELADECDAAPAALRATVLVALGGHTQTGVQSVVEAKNAAAMLCAELKRCGEELWRQLAASLGVYGLEAPPGFLLSLVQLSYLVPLDAEGLNTLVRIALDFVDAAGGDADAAVLTALCFIAANCSCGPSGLPSLSSTVGLVSGDVKSCLDQRWERWMWQGCVRMEVLSQWTVSIEIAQALQHFPDVLDVHAAQCTAEPPLPTEESLPTAAPGRVPAGARLQDLMQDAPPPFRCGISSQLMMDPVQTPQGAVVERAVLADALARSGGVCPLSGDELGIDDCPRQPVLRRRITKWIRERKAFAAQRRLEARE